MVSIPKFLNAISAYNNMSNLVKQSSKSAVGEDGQGFPNVLQSALTSYNGDKFPNKISQVASKDGATSGNLSEMLGNSFAELKQRLHKSENITHKALLKEASLVDVVEATTQAEHTLHQIINIRDKMIAAYQDVMKMAI